jgi:predicted dehydrogenase
MIKIGVIGYGYWGPNLVRNFCDCADTTVVAVSDLDPRRLQSLCARYPAVRTTTDYREMLRGNEIDAVAIATPVSTHFNIAMEALRAGKHVWVEKPLTRTTAEGEQLVNEAERRNLLLHVDHTFVYTGAVRKIHELVRSGSLGQVYYYDSVRVNLGLFQHDINVVWDLAVHDLSILDFLLESQPEAVSATGMSHVHGRPENLAFITLFFHSNLIAHLHVNWLSPVKVRKTLIGGSQKMVVFDDLETSEKVKVYDKGITLSLAENPDAVYKELVGYRTGDMWSPKLDTAEALQIEAEHFVDCIEGREKPITDGSAGLRVVQILEAASRSMAERGRPVELTRSLTAAWSHS